MARHSRGGIICIRVSVLVLFSYAIIFLYFSPTSKKSVVVHGDARSEFWAGEQKPITAAESLVEEFNGALEANKALEFDVKVTTKAPTTTSTKAPVEILVQVNPNKILPELSPKDKERIQEDADGCPASVLTIGGTTKLASCIWEYVTVYSLSKFLPGNRVPYVPKSIITTMTQFFDNVDLPQLETIPKSCSCNKKTDWKTPNVEVSDFIPLDKVPTGFANKRGNIILSAYSLLIEPVLLKIDEIKKVLVYKSDIIAETAKTMNTVKSVFMNSNKNVRESNITYIGVNIRRTDFLDYAKSNLNVSVVGTQYFKAATNYFRERPVLGTPVFLVVCDDMDWAEKNLAGSDVFFASKGGPQNPGHDLVLLSRCNHSIIDYGIFGLWTAIFAGGETIAVNSTSQVNRILGKRPNWHLVDISKNVVIP